MQRERLARDPRLGAIGSHASMIDRSGPTIAARLGVTLEDVDGRVADWLARDATVVPAQ